MLSLLRSDCSKASGCHAVSKLFASLRLCVRQKKESRKDAKTQREVECEQLPPTISLISGPNHEREAT